MDSLRSMMEKIDDLKGEMPEGTYLKLCGEAKRQFETEKARPELYEVSYFEAERSSDVDEEDEDNITMYDDRVRLVKKTIICIVKNAEKYIEVIDKEGAVIATRDFLLCEHKVFSVSDLNCFTLGQDYKKNDKTGQWRAGYEYSTKLDNVYVIKMKLVHC
jgi:hypothetical protein